MNDFIASYFGGENLQELKKYEAWIQQQIETALKTIEDRSSLTSNPYRTQVEGLSGMNSWMKQRLDAKREVDGKESAQKRQQANVNDAYSQYINSLNKYNDLLNTIEAKVTQQLVSRPVNTDNIIKQLNVFFKMMARSPPPIVKKGSTLVFTTPQGENVPLVYLEGQDIKQSIMEMAITQLKGNGWDVTKMPTSTNLAILDLLRARGISVDSYLGTVQASVDNAPSTKYAALGIRLEPEEASLIYNLIVGDELRNRFYEKYGSTSEHPLGISEDKNYILLVNSLGISSEDGSLYFGVSGLLEVSAGQHQLTGVNGDQKTALSADSLPDGKDIAGAVAGTISWEVNPRLLLKVEGGIAAAEDKKTHTASIIDALSGQTAVSDDKLLVSSDAFNFQKFTAEFKPLQGQNQNNWVLSLSFNREQAGVDDAYGSKEEYFVSGGTRFDVPTKIGTLRFRY